MFKKAGEWIRKKRFRKNLPIAVLENSKLFYLYKDGTKKFIRETKVS